MTFFKASMTFLCQSFWSPERLNGLLQTLFFGKRYENSGADRKIPLKIQHTIRKGSFAVGGSGLMLDSIR